MDLKHLKVSAAILAAIGAVFMTGCSQPPPPPLETHTRYVSVDRPAEIPPGVVRYCWEEPLVQFERNGPGLDAEGEYYHPFYVAVREVRQGRWRPCQSVASEVKGDGKNER